MVKLTLASVLPPASVSAATIAAPTSRTLRGTAHPAVLHFGLLRRSPGQPRWCRYAIVTNRLSSKVSNPSSSDHFGATVQANGSSREPDDWTRDMDRRMPVAALGAAAAVVLAIGAWPASAGAVVSQPVSGGGYYVSGSAANGSVRFVVPSPNCGLNETSTIYTGLQSAGVGGSSATFASGVLSVCVAGLPGTIAVQYGGSSATAVNGVQPGDTVVVTFDHGTGTETLTDVSSSVTGTVDIPDVSSQAGVFFGVETYRPQPIPLIEGGKVTLTVAVDGGTLAAASPVKQTKRVDGVSLTPSGISKTGKGFTVREADHRIA